MKVQCFVLLFFFKLLLPNVTAISKRGQYWRNSILSQLVHTHFMDALMKIIHHVINGAHPTRFETNIQCFLEMSLSDFFLISFTLTICKIFHTFYRCNKMPLSALLVCFYYRSLCL